MLNYRHLYYFWMVAKEGGFSRAAERLDMAIQTISAQVRELERNLGHQLLAGRTRRGPDRCRPGGLRPRRGNFPDRPGPGAGSAHRRHQAGDPAVRGPVRRHFQLAAHALLGPVLDTPDLRLTCHEGEFEELLGELAQHHLDLVLAGQGAPANPNLRLTSDRLVSSPVDWYGPSRLLRRADVQAFPQSLERLPVLPPTGHSVLRQTLDRWFREQGIHPNVVGEFEDSALMSVFAARGLGVFPLSRLGGDDIGSAARPAAAGPPRRGPRGDPRYPQSPGTEPSPGATHPGAGQDFGFS